MSSMVMPAAASISASASTKGMPSRAASLRPMDDFPAPIIPMSTIERLPSAATSVASDGEAIILFCKAERRIGRLRGAPPRPKLLYTRHRATCQLCPNMVVTGIFVEQRFGTPPGSSVPGGKHEDHQNAWMAAVEDRKR